MTWGHLFVVGVFFIYVNAANEPKLRHGRSNDWDEQPGEERSD